MCCRLTSLAVILTAVVVLQPIANSAMGQDRTAGRFRLADDRPSLDLGGLESAGLRVLRSRHLVLVTDAVLEDVQGLPELADGLFVALEERQRPLKAAEDGGDFQVTGFLMDVPERFEAVGLLPDGEFVIRHGRHLGYRFWMRNQPSAYYRRHLLLHEFVHCWMMCESGMRDIPPLWYTEGVAEYFATHTEDPAAFGVLPRELSGFEGWGRIGVLREQAYGRPGFPVESVAVEEGGQVLRSVMYPEDGRFTSDLKYAQAWALVWLLRTHPELKVRFEGVNGVLSGREFELALGKLDRGLFERLSVLWLLMLDSLEEGFDERRSFPDLDPEWRGVESVGGGMDVEVVADRGWQASGIFAESAVRLRISAAGRCVMHDQPAAWVSEPQGITIDYHLGRPIGELTAIVIPREASEPVRRIGVGREGLVEMPANSELWLQVNDSEAARLGNSGAYEVRMVRE
ncbi:MAG: hypothetical protein RL215_638 [Planctomycetota bacterium]|jgi:hypothetical protein